MEKRTLQYSVAVLFQDQSGSKHVPKIKVNVMRCKLAVLQSLHVLLKTDRTWLLQFSSIWGKHAPHAEAHPARSFVTPLGRRERYPRAQGRSPGSHTALSFPHPRFRWGLDR